MNSLKQRWEKFRSQASSNLVRSNSFTLQLSPSFFKEARLTRSNNNNNNNNGSHSNNYNLKFPISLTAFSFSSDKSRGSCVFPVAVQHNQQKVRYIFGTTLRRRPSCLRMLQEPLRDVYLAYMTKNSSVPGIIDISPNGLRVQYARYDGTDIEEFTNSFQSIAYWAAVQCVVREHIQNGQNGLHIGFFPFSQNGQWLVQGEGLEPESAFMWLDGEEQHQSLLRTEHPPLFACVMRQKASRSLRCHVFICSSSQQAIALASALYDIVKVNLRQSVSNSFKRSQSASGSKNSVKSQKRAKKKLLSSVHQQSEDRLAVKQPRSLTKTMSPHRSSSFSHLMIGLRRLAIKDLVPSPDTSRAHRCSSPQIASPKTQKGHIPRSHKRNRHKKTSPKANALICTEAIRKSSESSKRRYRSRSIAALDSSNQKETVEDSNWKYKVLSNRDSPEPPAPPPRPCWMKLLMNLSLRQENRDKRTCVFNFSRAQRQRGSMRPLTSSKAQMAVVLASKGQWLNRISNRSSMPLLTCTCKQDLEMKSRVSAMLKNPSKETKHHIPKKSCAINDTGYLPMGSSQSKKPDEAYDEIQETRRPRSKGKPKAPEPYSVSENNLFNKQMMLADVPCTIGRDAALDDDSDSFNSSMVLPVPCVKSGSAVNTERMCPHMANPQLVFRKFLPGNIIRNSRRKYGWNLSKTSHTPKTHSAPNPRGAANDETPLLKKDAEIVSILDQIANNAKTQHNNSTSNTSELRSSAVCTDEESQGQNTEESDSWGWSTFLP